MSLMGRDPDVRLKLDEGIPVRGEGLSGLSWVKGELGAADSEGVEEVDYEVQIRYLT